MPIMLCMYVRMYVVYTSSKYYTYVCNRDQIEYLHISNIYV